MVKCGGRMITISISLVVFFAAALPLTSWAQQNPEPGTMGISASIQSNQVDLLVPLWLSRSLVVAPSFGFASATSSGTDISFGMEVKVMLQRRRAVPYVGARFVVASLMPSGGSNESDFVLGPAFGGEYFLSDNFSLAVEAQLNVALSANGSYRFGNPGGTNINTAAVALASVYF